MGYRAGTTLQADCGAVVVFVKDCPDPAQEWACCACGAEMLPIHEGDEQHGGSECATIPSAEAAGTRQGA